MYGRPPDSASVDISKAHLDAHRRSTGGAVRLANEVAGFEELAAEIGDPAAPVARVNLPPAALRVGDGRRGEDLRGGHADAGGGGRLVGRRIPARAHRRVRRLGRSPAP